MSRPVARAETLGRAGLIGAGGCAVTWGLWLLADQSRSDLLSAGAWFVVPAVLSDLVLLPAVALVGAVLTHHLEPWLRLPAQVALAVIGILTFIALPFLTGIGRQAGNPSLLNRNYPLGLAVYVLAILLVAGCWATARRRRTVPPPDRDRAPETTW